MKTLIVYATKYGSTKKCAELVKTFLDGDTRIAQIKNDAIALSEYNSVIVGGPVYMGKMHSDISAFCKRYKNQLLSKRLALFACCYTPSEDAQYLKKLFPKELLGHSLCTTTVGGIMDYKKMNFFYRKMFQSLKKIDDFNKEFTEPEIRIDDIRKIANAINMRP